MAFSKLTRKNGVKVAPNFPCSVEECSLVVGYGSVKATCRMGGGTVLFIDSVEKVNKLIDSGVVIADQLVPVLPLSTPSQRVIISNVPPFISDQFIVEQLSRHGKVISPVRKLPSGCKSSLLSQAVSYRRAVQMILNDRDAELDLVIKARVDDFDYILFATSGPLKCFRCGQEGHVVRACPQRPVRTPDERNARTSEAGQGAEGGDGGDLVPGTSGPSQQQEGRQTGVGEQEEPVEKVAEWIEEVAAREVEAESQPVEDVVEVDEEVDKGVDEVEETVESQSPPRPKKKKRKSTEVEKVVDGEGGSSPKRDAGNATQQKLYKDSPVITSSDGNGDDGKAREEQVGAGSLALEPGEIKGRRGVSHSTESAGTTGEEKGGDQLGSDLDSSEGVDLGGETSSSDMLISGTQVTSKETLYGIKEVKKFLRMTKNKRNVDVEESFVDKVCFIRSVRAHMRDRSESGYTDQESYRLVKLLKKLGQELETDKQVAS